MSRAVRSLVGLSMLLLLSSFIFAADILTVEMKCKECEKIIPELLSSVKGLELNTISFEERTVCLEGNYEKIDVARLLQEEGYTILQQEEGSCVIQSKGVFAALEERTTQGDVDFAYVSHGESFKLRKELVKGKYTLFDFGADWCGVCYEATTQLAVLAQNRDDVALRAIHLPGDEVTSFEQPVVFQYLYEAPGLPWFLLYGPDKKKVYEGNELSEILNILPPHQESL